MAAEQVSLTVDGGVVSGTGSATPRPDVSGGHGFVFRFPAPPNLSGSVRVRVACDRHPRSSLEAVVPFADWDLPALGAIEWCVWPVVSGWVAILDEPPGGIALELGDGVAIPLRGSIPRPDVVAHLGSAGVLGFQAMMVDSAGYTVPDGTNVRLMAGGRVVAEGVMSSSPLDPAPPACLTGGRGRPAGREPASLTWRLATVPEMWTEPPTWHEGMSRLGLVDDSAEAAQWAALLEARGWTQGQIAAALAVRVTVGLDAPHVDPLPAVLRSHLGEASTMGLPLRARDWLEVTAPPLGHGREQSYTTEMPSRELSTQVCVAGLVHHRSGLGQNAQHSLSALELAGIHGCTASFFPGQGGWNRDLGVDAASRRDLADHAVLLHVPVDRVVQSLSVQPALLASDRLIGYFMWETEHVPREFYRPLQLVDEIWTATEFVAEAYRRVTDRPVHVTGHAVDVSGVSPVHREELGIADDAFVTHFSFDANSTVARKNPNAAIDAFLTAFGDDPEAVFILKVRNMQQVEHLARQGDPHARGLIGRLEANPRIVLVTGEWTHARSLGLIQMADCFISLHRSEGYGYAIAEAMALGTPVVATGYSGNLDFLSEREGWLVSHTMVDVAPGEYFYWEPGMAWAEPDVWEAAEALQDIRWGQGVSMKVDAARARVQAECSLQELSQRYASTLAGVTVVQPRT